MFLLFLKWNNQFIVEKKQQAEVFMSFANILSLEDVIVEQVIQIKQAKKLNYQYAIIAATVLYYNMSLVTHNTKDFNGINIEICEPFSL